MATFAVPANAEPVCHEAPPAATAVHHHGQPARHQPQQQVPAMEDHCLGCIAPATIRAPQIARPAVATRIDGQGEPLPGTPRAAVPPATPPPRSGPRPFAAPGPYGQRSRRLGRARSRGVRARRPQDDELFPDHAHPLHDRAFRVTRFEAGYAHRFRLAGPLSVAIGGSALAVVTPDALDPWYGKSPLGWTGFVKLTLDGG